MPKSTKKSIGNNVSSELKTKHERDLDKQIISKQKKEIVRLHKLLAKADVKLQSEIARVRAEEFEKYRRKCLQITPETSPEEASRIYQEFIKGGRDENT